MPGIKMAKAKVSEIDDAIKLAHLTDAVCNCRSFEYPEFPAESDDVLPENFDVESSRDLRKFYDRVSKLSGGLMRVVFGYGVLVDNCCDLTKDVLELKPGMVTFDDDEKKALEDFRIANMAYEQAVKDLRKVEDSMRETHARGSREYSDSYHALNTAISERFNKALEFSTVMLKSVDEK